jgi:hypothetical protein
MVSLSPNGARLMNRWIVAALCSSLVVGCGASNDAPIVAADSGTGGGADTGSPVDTGASTDRGSATTDRGSSTDRGSATTDRGAPTSNFGTCGETVARQVCMCGQMDNVCQSQALSSDMNCAQCLVANQAACCPTEAMALQTCIQGAQMTCSDQACLQRTCMTQVAAMQTCQMSRLQTEAMAGMGACLQGYIGCIGVLSQGFGSCP